MQLPEITMTAMKQTMKELESVGESDYLEKVLSRLERENPLILQFIHRMTGSMPNKKNTVATSLIICEMLELQFNLNEKLRKKYEQN